MFERGVTRGALGWACVGLAAVVLGLLLAIGGVRSGQTIAVMGAVVVVACLGVLARGLLRD